jgi:transposase InsO family protein
MSRKARIFKEKVYGSKKYTEVLTKIGISGEWSHPGRPKKYKKGEKEEDK